jgi:hypothetical protein
MTPDDIIRMKWEAGVHTAHTDITLMRGLERFAVLVAAAEREACAKLVEDMDLRNRQMRPEHHQGLHSAVRAIRARGLPELTAVIPCAKNCTADGARS